MAALGDPGVIAPSSLPGALGTIFPTMPDSIKHGPGAANPDSGGQALPFRSTD